MKQRKVYGHPYVVLSIDGFNEMLKRHPERIIDKVEPYEGNRFWGDKPEWVLKIFYHEEWQIIVELEDEDED